MQTNKNFRKIYVDDNGNKWINNGSDLTRVFGSNFIKNQKVIKNGCRAYDGVGW